MFKHEKALSVVDKDALGREPYAQHLAKSLEDYIDPENSLVVGLYGPWGDGKTSLWSLIKRNINPENSVIVEFHPWEFSQQDKILKSFFWALYDALKNEGSEGKKVANALIKYFYTFLEHTNSLVKLIKENFDNITAAISGAGVLIGLSLPDNQKQTWLFSVLLLFIFLRLLLVVLKKIMGEPTENFEQAKKELSGQIEKFFRNCGKNLLVVIDDIDRLTPEQIKLIFQIVKVNADFPRTTYLLLFDRTIIETTLNDKENGIEGARYLEKIIQIGFDVPEADIHFLHYYAEVQIKEIVEQKGLGAFWDNDRWSTLYGRHLCFYFSNLREVKRFLNSLDFHIAFLSQDGCEIDLVDFISLEIVRVFEPGLYYILPEIRSMIVFQVQRFDRAYVETLYSGAQNRPMGPEDTKEFLINKIRNSIKANEKLAFEILKNLFPKLKALIDDRAIDSDTVDSTFELKRVAHDYTFDWYFQYQNPSGLSIKEIKNIYANSNNREYLCSEFIALLQQGKLRSALYFVETSVAELPVTNSKTFITALLDVERHLPLTRAVLKTSPQDLIETVIKKVLRQNYSNLEDRTEILSYSFIDSNALFVPLSIVDAWARFYASEDYKKRVKEQCLLDKQGVRNLQDLLLCKINTDKDLSEGTLKDHKFLSLILWYWKEWTSDEVVKEWVNALIENEEDFWLLVESFSGAYYYRVGLDYLHDFADINLFKEKLKQYSSKPISKAREMLANKIKIGYQIID